jgi:hypothetical protein
VLVQAAQRFASISIPRYHRLRTHTTFGGRTMSRISTTALCALFLLVAPFAIATSYVADVQPILEAKCVGCHTAGSSGGHNIGNTYSDGLLDSYHCAGLDKAACSVERIKAGTMPNGTGIAGGCGGAVADDDANAAVCVTVSELATLEAWIAAGAPKEACQPATDCGGMTCGSMDDGCGGTLVCGECAEGESCTEGSCCAPVTECGDVACGSMDDGCGGTVACGDCPEGQGCDQGTCVEGCVPATCADGACGDMDDGCGGTAACGDCADGSTCTDGMCVEDCAPMSCTEGACGDMDDGCGGTAACGECADGSTCTEGACVEDCVPADACGDVACGAMDDGCGGTLVCGECAEGESCAEGVCAADEEPQPVATGPDYLNDVQPILEAKCAACHTVGASGGHSIGMNYEDGQDDSYSCPDKNIATCSVDRIKDGSMPQGKGCEGVVADGAPNADVCVTESEIAILEAWLTAGTPEAVTSDGTGDGGGDEPDDGDPAPDPDDVTPDDVTPDAGGESDDGGCQSTEGSLGGLMVLLAGLALFASRRRSVFDQ